MKLLYSLLKPRNFYKKVLILLVIEKKTSLLYIFILLIERQNKESAQKVWSKTWYTKKPFGYRVVHHMLIKFLKSYYT